eukprot:279093_1
MGIIFVQFIKEKVIDPTVESAVLVFKVVHEGVVSIFDLIEGKHACLRYCGNNRWAKIECDEDEIAFCACDKCGKPIEECFTKEQIEFMQLKSEIRIRRLLQTAPDLPYLDQCIENERCRNMLTLYRYDGLDPSDIQSPEDKCAELEYECTDQELELLQNVIDEIGVNFPTSAEEMCSGFYDYLDDGMSRTFDEAEAVCQDDFLSDLV